jgi:hypothetical protein
LRGLKAKLRVKVVRGVREKMKKVKAGIRQK